MSNEEKYFKDILGNKTQVGDTVALASRVGNSAEMKVRVILEIGDKLYYNSPEVKVVNPDTGRTAYPSATNMINITRIMKEGNK